jgi:hypothetical protein
MNTQGHSSVNVMGGGGSGGIGGSNLNNLKRRITIKDLQ